MKSKKQKQTKSPKVTNKTLPKKRIKILLPLLVVIALAGGLFYFKNQFIVATVNGKPIWRKTLVGELEKQAGKKTLDSLITKTLILQEAQKKNVTVSDQEVNEEIKKLEDNFTSRGQDLNQLLAAQNMTRKDLFSQIKIQKLVEKIVGKDVAVSDEEINDYIEKNKNLIPQGMAEDEVKTNVKQQLEQQKRNEKIQKWIKSLRDNAKINYFL
jgi:foldase protein PrsA